MDLAKIKRFANSEFESWKIAKAVTEVKNEIKDAEQGRDVVMSDVFKTLRDPLIEQQKKTDAKQDAVIEQLRENQLALTGGLKDLVESNRDVLTLQQELPFPGGMEALPAAAAAAAAPKKASDVYDLNKPFNNDEMKILRENDFPVPNKLVTLEKQELDALQKIVTDAKNNYSRRIGTFKRIKNPNPHEIRSNAYNEGRRETMKKYLEAITLAAASSKYKQGTGIRKYKQPKRNAYKISDSSFGNLSVDVPKLKNEMKLNVFRGGKLIYHADADKSLVDLLTKRFNPKRSYSLNAVKIFNDLNLLANLSPASFFGEIKTPWIWSGVLQQPK